VTRTSNNSKKVLLSFHQGLSGCNAFWVAGFTADLTGLVTFCFGFIGCEIDLKIGVSFLAGNLSKVKKNISFCYSLTFIPSKKDLHIQQKTIILRFQKKSDHLVFRKIQDKLITSQSKWKKKIRQTKLTKQKLKLF
jgi:hypothetical protein